MDVTPKQYQSAGHSVQVSDGLESHPKNPGLHWQSDSRAAPRMVESLLTGQFVHTLAACCVE
jgi:hypothetical protein